MALHAIAREVPLHSLAHVRHVARNQRAKTHPETTLPPWHRSDVSLQRGIAIRFCSLRISSRKEDGSGLAALPRPRRR